ncbi:hypothetical protein SDJN02_10179 [Cucurbita argyrosperma subsp. argyrosperma]|nr:hypothetical protein SDJN02_10179 [Cucurbita argyrosperma subsp. argyrosperma]
MNELDASCRLISFRYQEVLAKDGEVIERSLAVEAANVISFWWLNGSEIDVRKLNVLTRHG